MSSQRPETVDEILATGKMDPVLKSILDENPLPALSSFTLSELKEINDIGLAVAKKRLATSRPASVVEREHMIPMDDRYMSRIIVCHHTEPTSAQSPLIVYLHGGGQTIGYPENGTLLARNLVQAYSAVVVLVSYRLAPEHPFPRGVNDVISTVTYLAAETVAPHKPERPLFPPDLNLNLEAGFLLGGESAGSGLTAVATHVLRDRGMSPTLTGQFLFAGTFISHRNVPPKYKDRYLSRQQNKDAPCLDEKLADMFSAALNVPSQNPLYTCFVQHPEDPEADVAAGHMGLPRAYFQVCGLDMFRDDGLIYEKCLREECGIETRLDLYSGWPHCWWTMLPDAEKTQQRMADAVKGIGWLLGRE